MLCYLLAIAAVLILISTAWRKTSLAILTVFFIFSFFIIWLFVSAADLIPEEQSMLRKDAFIDCYHKFYTCSQDLLKNIKIKLN